MGKRQRVVKRKGKRARERRAKSGERKKGGVIGALMEPVM
jgi:hypothetical protein